MTSGRWSPELLQKYAVLWESEELRETKNPYLGKQHFLSAYQWCQWCSVVKISHTPAEVRFWHIFMFRGFEPDSSIC